MEQRNWASRKSRIVLQRARASVWRAVGSITIVAPELHAPLVLENGSYTVIFQERRHEGELRDAVVLLHRFKRPFWVSVYWHVITMVFAAAVTRCYYVL